LAQFDEYLVKCVDANDPKPGELQIEMTYTVVATMSAKTAPSTAPKPARAFLVYSLTSAPEAPPQIQQRDRADEQPAGEDNGNEGAVHACQRQVLAPAALQFAHNIPSAGCETITTRKNPGGAA
jgi:hypothetical protein